jgi:hypothetical protein
MGSTGTLRQATVWIVTLEELFTPSLVMEETSKSGSKLRTVISKISRLDFAWLVMEEESTHRAAMVKTFISGLKIEWLGIRKNGTSFRILVPYKRPRKQAINTIRKRKKFISGFWLKYIRS